MAVELSDLQKKAFTELIKMETVYKNQIGQQLKKSLIEIQGQLVEFYNKWSTEGVLTKSEMVKYGRLVTMEKELFNSLSVALKSSSSLIKKIPVNQYIESYNYYAWAFDNAVGVNLNWGILNKNAIVSTFAISNPNNIEYKQALVNYNMNSRKYIRNAILNGLAQGKSLSKMSNDLKISVNKTFNEAMRIVSTEAMAALHAGQNATYARAFQQGIQGHEEWYATRDLKTRDSHHAVDGQKKDNNGYYHVPGPIGIELAPYPGFAGLSAANRINCRCDSIFIIDGYSDGIMRTKGEGVIPYIPYTVWIKKYGPIMH
jgi:hypothetical protein